MTVWIPKDFVDKFLIFGGLGAILGLVVFIQSANMLMALFMVFGFGGGFAVISTDTQYGWYEIMIGKRS